MGFQIIPGKVRSFTSPHREPIHRFWSLLAVAARRRLFGSATKGHGQRCRPIRGHWAHNHLGL